MPSSTARAKKPCTVSVSSETPPKKKRDIDDNEKRVIDNNEKRDFDDNAFLTHNHFVLLPRFFDVVFPVLGCNKRKYGNQKFLEMMIAVYGKYSINQSLERDTELRLVIEWFRKQTVLFLDGDNNNYTYVRDEDALKMFLVEYENRKFSFTHLTMIR
jgi:hypothetical protein